MDQLLNPVQTKISNASEKAEPLLKEESTKGHAPDQRNILVNSPGNALEILQSKPTPDELSRVLRWANGTRTNTDEGFNIKWPSPNAGHIIFVLVNDVIPDHWDILNASESPRDRKSRRVLLNCLSSVSGVGALTSRLRLLTEQLKDPQHRESHKAGDKARPLVILISVLELILQDNGFAAEVWADINSFNLNPSQKSLQWKGFLSLLASGRLLSIVSEASHSLNKLNSDVTTGSWLGDGNAYAAWLGTNIRYMVNKTQGNDVERRKASSQVLSKALKLGYTDQVIQTAYADLVSGDEHSVNQCRDLMTDLGGHEQKTVFFSLIRILAHRYISSDYHSGSNSKITTRSGNLGGIAAILMALVDNNPDLQGYLLEWLTGISAHAIGQSHIMHRAVVAVISQGIERSRIALQKALELFGDKIYIKHTPILHQEVNAQVLLLLAGYVHRADRPHLIKLCQSSLYLNAISNHLAAASHRARFLGMVVGTAISDLVDPKDKRMNFSSEDMESSEGLWYRTLMSVNDPIGSIQDLKASSHTEKHDDKFSKSAVSKGKSTMPATQAVTNSKIISIEEVEDTSESEDDDLPTYEKPDSDPSDEDEDPELVQRNKPTAPVYIRDVLSGLRDTENYDRHTLALTNASSLIRRKAAFGTEVSDNIEDLATLLVGLSDRWEMEKFQQFRLQGMIAVLTAEPLKMGQWFSKTFYNGDYSMSQRASILTTLGLGARELAGLGKEDAAITGATASTNAFPSKRLPDKLHKIYTLEAAPMDTLSTRLEQTMIQPLAASAADKLTGPNALKIRTFSSRMAVEKKRAKPMPNALAKIVAEGFFFPLTGRWLVHLQAFGESTTHTSPLLLPHLLRTLALILHASSPSLSLPALTAEFWDLLLSLRPRCSEMPVLEALLFGLLTLFNVNEDDQRRLAEEHARELLETQQWVEGVLEQVGGSGEEGERVGMLAAGVMVRCREVVERWQRVLMGDMVDFM